MRLELYHLGWLFFAYSFLGWLLETIAAAVRHKRFVNRGVIDGPLCSVYGVAAVIVTIALTEQKANLPVLFLGSMIFCTVIEWIAGHLLEQSAGGKWWDYSNHKCNLDGYICLRYSLIWGALGSGALLFLNPLLRRLLNLVPTAIGTVALWIIGGLYLLDLLGAYTTVLHLGKTKRQVEEVNNRLARFTRRLSVWLRLHVERRLARAYPQISAKKAAQKSAVFAEGCSFYKLVWLFFIGAFLGDMTETVFCRITAGVWMSRSSVVWGPFSIVWGLALALATALLHRYREKPMGFLFLFGAVLGGAYEYLCSVFTEVMFGTVFWDYSEIPFNLGGRINLLYCVFWGVAAVVWLKFAYPRLSTLIEKVPKTPGKIISWVLIVFMTANMVVSGMALARYALRAEGVAPQSGWAEYIDASYPDKKMEKIYPNAIKLEKQSD